METTVIEHLRVKPNIGLLNEYVRKVREVAISSIDPVFAGDELEAFSIRVEGPPRHMSYFNRLIKAADFKVS